MDQVVIAQHITQYFDKFSYHVQGTTLCFHDVSVVMGKPIGLEELFKSHWHPASEKPEAGKWIVSVTNNGSAHYGQWTNTTKFGTGVAYWCYYAPEPDDPDGFHDWHQKWMPGWVESTARIAFDAARNAGKEGK